MSITWDEDTWQDIGGGVEITYQTDDTGRRVGLIERHTCEGGRLSRGSVPFADRMDSLGNGSRWTVEQEDPLTLSPSIACQTCPNHGFIRYGRWVSA